MTYALLGFLNIGPTQNKL